MYWHMSDQPSAIELGCGGSTHPAPPHSPGKQMDDGERPCGPGSASAPSLSGSAARPHRSLWRLGCPRLSALLRGCLATNCTNCHECGNAQVPWHTAPTPCASPAPEPLNKRPCQPPHLPLPSVPPANPWACGVPPVTPWAFTTQHHLLPAPGPVLALPTALGPSPPDVLSPPRPVTAWCPSHPPPGSTIYHSL